MKPSAFKGLAAGTIVRVKADYPSIPAIRGRQGSIVQEVATDPGKRLYLVRVNGSIYRLFGYEITREV